MVGGLARAFAPVVHRPRTPALRCTVSPMAHTYRDLEITARAGGQPIDPASSHAWVDLICWRCGTPQMFVVARTAEIDGTTPPIYWLRCGACSAPSVRDRDGVVAPTPLPLDLPRGLPVAEAAAWEEVRRCLGVGAHTAAVMMCRKILFHVAVTNDMEPKDEKTGREDRTSAQFHVGDTAHTQEGPDYASDEAVGRPNQGRRQ